MLNILKLIKNLFPWLTSLAEVAGILHHFLQKKLQLDLFLALNERTSKLKMVHNEFKLKKIM